MTPDVVRSPRNSRVAEAARLQRTRARAETGLTLLEGPHLLAEAAGVRILRVFGLPDDLAAEERAGELEAEWIPVTRRVLERIAPTEHPRGPVAVMEVPEEGPAGPGGTLVLWGVGDPGNAGTLIRTASAFGFDVRFVAGSVDAWSPKVLRAAAGGHFRTGIRHRPGLTPAVLREEGYTVVATVARGGSAPWEAELGGRPALLVGEEAHGLPEEVVFASDVRITIPMVEGIESLNAAVAGALVMYEAVRRASV